MFDENFGSWDLAPVGSQEISVRSGFVHPGWEVKFCPPMQDLHIESGLPVRRWYPPDKPKYFRELGPSGYGGGSLHLWTQA